MATRREALLSGAAMLGLAARSRTLRAEPTTSETPKMRIVCLEEHVHDPVVAAAVGARFAAEAPYLRDIGSRYQDAPERAPADRPRLTFVPSSMRIAAAPLAARLPAMDAAGIDRQVLSLSNEPQLAPRETAAALVRAANDRLAASVAAHPSRFSAFFTLPWQDPDAAVREAERCVRELRLTATLITGRPMPDLFLDDPRFDPVLAKLAELDAPLYVHPGPPLGAVREPYYGGFDPELSARLSLFGWGWHNEAGVHVVRLILSGALDRHRRLRLVSGHWGEMVPFFLQRMDDTMPREVTGLSRTIGETYREQVWVGPSGMLQTPHFMFVRDVVGIDRVVFSIDFPYLTMTGARRWLERLRIPHAEKEAFAFRNAEALLGLA